ncbi:hypothetical protein D9756_001809 [Leucocoprinus leucothites]|uniref:AN1-type domain-containing protein n=1 Tax=Leucocoprinus leucothites TaxID=201217 RepID=A0A8H5G3W5_9AGAR|nr:hypothetical protein D9756_001809 [Leucoagaricus leucothites]
MKVSCDVTVMASSLLDIGAQCSLDSCPAHDFLPVLCPNCSKYFCKDHIHSDLHSCLPSTQKPDVQHDKLQRCALDDCDRLSLDAYNSTVAAACANCSKSFCAEHRHPVSHKCSPIDPPAGNAAPQKNEKARELLAKISSSSTSSKKPLKKPAKIPTDPAKLAAYRKVEVMKMRHKAVPLDPKDKSASPPLDQRLHVKVQFGEQEKVFWVRKTLITGKALDFLCGQFGIKHSDALPTRLYKPESEAHLRNDTSLSEQVDDGSVLSIVQES